MKFFPSPDGVFNWRFFKQFLAFGVFVATMMAAPLLFALSPEVVMTIISANVLSSQSNGIIYNVGQKVRDLLGDYKDSKSVDYILNFIEGSLSLLANGFLHLFLAVSFMPEKEGLSSLSPNMSLRDHFPKQFKESEFALFEMQLLGAMGGILLKKLINTLNFISSAINEKILDEQQADEAKKIAYSSYEQVQFQVESLSKKAGLPGVSTSIKLCAEHNAYACSNNHVFVYSGLLETAEAKELTWILSHEVGHLTRSFLDFFISYAPHYWSPTFCNLYMAGFGLVLLQKISLEYWLGLTAAATVIHNVTSCIISQSEEERADRMSCHLLDDLTILNQKTIYNSLNDGKFPEEKQDKSLSRFIPKSEDIEHCTAFLMGYATHPKPRARFESIQDEVAKIKKCRS